MLRVLLGGLGGAVVATIINIIYSFFVRRTEFRRAYFLEIIRQQNRTYESIISELVGVQDLLSWAYYPHGAEKVFEARAKWMNLFDFIIPKAAIYIEPEIMEHLNRIRTDMEYENWKLVDAENAKVIHQKLKGLNDKFIEDLNLRINDIIKKTAHQSFKKFHADRATSRRGAQASAPGSDAK